MMYEGWPPRRLHVGGNDPCSYCGYPGRAPLPEWAQFGAHFAVDGQAYRVISRASTNRRTRENKHFEDYVIAEPIDAEQWSLPETMSELGSRMKSLFELPQFFPEQLTDVLRVA